jgi:hypothetical protein
MSILEVISPVSKSETKINQSNTITYVIPNAKFPIFSKELFTLFICNLCGGYCHSKDSMSRRIFCTCSDVFGNKQMQKQHANFNQLLNELIFKKYSDDSSESSLEYSRYFHKGECVPNSRTCRMCWRYRCNICDGGVAGVLGKCMYKRCRMGRKNSGLEY